MAYTLAAFIGKAVTLQQQSLRLPQSKLIYLPQGFAMIPTSRKLIEVPDPTTEVEPFYSLSVELYNWALNASSLGPIGFLEIETFGGYGERSAILWKDQQVAFKPTMSIDTSVATNQVLALLGVQKSDSYDEFDALGFGRHRSNEEWLSAI